MENLGVDNFLNNFVLEEKHGNRQCEELIGQRRVFKMCILEIEEIEHKCQQDGVS